MSDKVPGWAIDAALEVVDSDMFKGLMAVERVGKCSEMVAAALLSAYRRGRDEVVSELDAMAEETWDQAQWSTLKDAIRRLGEAE